VLQWQVRKLSNYHLFLAPSFTGFRSSLSNDISSTVEKNSMMMSGDGGIFSDGEIKIASKQRLPGSVLQRTPGFDPSEESDFY
jgi:hypothetical protein